jgi:histone H3/H4
MIEPQKEFYEVQIDEQGDERLVLQPTLSSDKFDEHMAPEFQFGDSKKARSGFMIFISENKEVKKNLGKNFLKEMSQLWSDLDPNSKQVYLERSRVEKEMFAKHGKPSLTEKDTRRSKSSTINSMPVKTVKTIINLDPEIAKKIRPEAYAYLATALDLFVDTIIQETELMARKANKKKLTELHIYNLAKKELKYGFLKDLKVNADIAMAPKNKGLDEELPPQTKEPSGQIITEEAPRAPRSLAKEQSSAKNQSLLNFFKK